MKKKAILILLTSLTFFSMHAQQKVDMFCKVTVGEFYFGKHLGWKDSALLSYRVKPELLHDNKMDTLNLKQVEKLKTDVDVLNFMSSKGWEMLCGTPTETWGIGNSIHQTLFYFHKKVDN